MEAETLADTQGELKDKAVLNALADTLAEIGAEYVWRDSGRCGDEGSGQQMKKMKAASPVVTLTARSQRYRPRQLAKH